MASFFSFIKTRKYPSRDTFIKLFEGPFSWYTAALALLAAATIVITYFLLIKLNDRLLVAVPARGGSLTEGVIGAPRFINPVLAATQTDVGLTALVYAGLVKHADDDSIIPAMAETYRISPDGRTYEFSLKKDIAFHDKTPMTAEDVAYTYEILKEETIDVAHATYWQSIQIEILDPYTVTFRLPQPDSTFLSKLTMGIMPKNLWEPVAAQDFRTATANLAPVGTGPFMVESITYKNNIPTEIILKDNPRAYERPYLDELRIAFFANQDDLLEAINDERINMTASLPPSYAKLISDTDITIKQINTETTIELLRTRNEANLDNASVVSILDRFIDKNDIIATVEHGYGTALSVPQEGLPISSDDALSQLRPLGYLLEDGVLKKRGVPVQVLIAVENTKSMLETARIVQRALGTIGIGVSIQAFDQGTFQAGVRAGEYQLIITNSSDTTTPPGYQSVIPLYAKTLPYILDSKARNIAETIPISVSERYRHSTKWYVYTERLWTWFAPKQSTTTQKQ